MNDADFLAPKLEKIDPFEQTRAVQSAAEEAIRVYVKHIFETLNQIKALAFFPMARLAGSEEPQFGKSEIAALEQGQTVGAYFFPNHEHGEWHMELGMVFQKDKQGKIVVDKFVFVPGNSEETCGVVTGRDITDRLLLPTIYSDELEVGSSETKPPKTLPVQLVMKDGTAVNLWDAEFEQAEDLLDLVCVQVVPGQTNEG